MLNVLAVFIGGGIGSLIRYGVTHMTTYYHLNSATGTWVANVVSCTLLGFMVGIVPERSWSMAPAWKLFFTVGLCGGFSTFSTFSLETLEFFKIGQPLYGLLNISLSLLVCMLAISGGVLLSRMVTL